MENLYLYGFAIKSAYNLINKFKDELNREFLFTPMDAANEVIAQGCEDKKSAKKVIDNFILNEMRRNKSSCAMREYKKNKKHILLETHKQCSICKEILPLYKFKIDIETDTGYQNIRRECKDCYNAKQRTPEARERQRKQYASDPKYKIMRHNAYLRKLEREGKTFNYVQDGEKLK